MLTARWDCRDLRASFLWSWQKWLRLWGRHIHIYLEELSMESKGMAYIQGMYTVGAHLFPVLMSTRG